MPQRARGTWMSNLKALGFAAGAMALLLSLCPLAEGAPPLSSASDPAQEQYILALNALKDELYPTAIEAFKEYLSRYPQGAKAREARLLLAGALYKTGRFKEAASAYEAFLRNHPEDPLSENARYKGALSSFLAGEWALAAERFGRVKKEPLAQEALFWRGEAYLRLEKWKEAIESFSLLVKRFPQGKRAQEARLKKAFAQLSLKDLKGARDTFEEALPSVRETSLRIRLLLQLANLAEGFEDWPQAARRYEELLKLSPPDNLRVEAMFGFARNIERARGCKEAISPYREFVKEARKHRMRPEALYALGNCQFREGRFREAAKAFDSFAEDYPSRARSPWALYFSGEALLKLEQREEALKRYLAVDSRYSGSPPHKESLAKAASLKFASGAYAEALALLRKLKKLGPLPEQSALVAFLEAESLFALKKYEDAEESYGLFISSHPKSRDVPEALFKRALSAYRAERFQKALEFFEEGLPRMTPEKRKEALYLAARSSERVGSLSKASSFWGRFLKESAGDPREAEALLSLGRARYGLKDYAGASSALKMWVERFGTRPERREAYLLLGHALLGAGDFMGAVQAYESLFAQGFVPSGAIFNLAYAYDKLGENEKALENFGRYLKAKPGAGDEGEVALRMGVLALELGKDEEAREAFELASRKGKGALKSEAEFRLAELELKRGRRGEALKLLLALSQEGAEPWAGAAVLRAGALLEEEKRWEEALELYRRLPQGSEGWKQAQERIGKIDAYLKAREKLGEEKKP